MLSALDALRGRDSTIAVEGDYPEAGVLVPLLQEGDTLSVLLTRRAGHLAIHAGEAAFPGGKREPGDVSLLATALREAQEEVALSPGYFEHLFTLDQRLTRTAIKVTPFVGLIPAGLPLVPEPGEIERIFTAPLAFFADPGNLEVVEVDYRGSLLRTARYHYGDQEVWGVTAMTLVDLVNTAFDAGLSV